MDFAGIAVIGALNRLGPAFIFKVESKKRGQARAKRIIGLKREQVTIVQDKKPLGIVAEKIQDRLASGAETIGAVNRDYVPKKVSKRDQVFPSARDSQIASSGALRRNAISYASALWSGSAASRRCRCCLQSGKNRQGCRRNQLRWEHPPLLPLDVPSGAGWWKRRATSQSFRHRCHCGN